MDRVICKQTKEVVTKVFEEHFDHLVLFVNQFVKSIPIAEDIIQELFVRLWEADKLKNCTVAFLYICARHDAMNYLRDHPENENIDNVECNDWEADSIEEFPAYYDKLEDVFRAVQLLSPQCRTVLHKIYFENKHYAEVAKEMGVSVNTVKTHIYLAIKNLKKDFSMYFFLMPLL